MISYEEALLKINNLQLPTNSVNRDLSQCLGWVLSEDILSPFPSPPFDNSAMDGFALNSECTDFTKPLRVAGQVFAGTNHEFWTPQQSQVCIEITTGAPIPSWCNTVIPVEHTRSLDAKYIAIDKPSKPGQFIRHKSSDLHAGEKILFKNRLIIPNHILIAATFGIAELPVYEKPMVSIISTGDELLPLGANSSYGKIYNSSLPYLKAEIKKLGFQNVEAKQIPDHPDQLCEHVNKLFKEKANRPFIIISTGAVSAGSKDFVPEVATKCKFEKIFHRLRIRPGGPVFLGRKDNCIWLGLPGNSISTVVGYNFIARPLLEKWTRLGGLKFRHAILSEPVRKPSHLRCFFRSYVTDGIATVSPKQGSAQIQSSIQANAFAIFPEGQDYFPERSSTQVIMM